MISNKNSYKTAIVRKNISAPARLISKKKLLVGECLDFGCGRGFDAAKLRMSKYDPYWSPQIPTRQFDTILCTYVLNTLSLDQQDTILDQILGLLSLDGTAYISVRRDIKKQGPTSKGTFQRNVKLLLPTLHKCSQFETYILKRVDSKKKRSPMSSTEAVNQAAVIINRDDFF